MEPDEEIDSLKARLAALEGARSTAPPVAKPPSKSANGCLLAIAIPIVAITLLVALGSLLPDPPSAPAAPVDDGACDATAAETALATTRLHLVRGETVARADGLVIMVRPRAWAALDFDQQQRVAALYDCAVAGSGKHLTVIRFRYERSGADLATFEATDLLRLRQSGMAAVSSGSRPGS